MGGTGKFLYFAFGSNMCTKRIHINNPSAVFKHVAIVQGYKLFFGYSDTNVSKLFKKLLRNTLQSRIFNSTFRKSFVYASDSETVLQP